MRYDETAKHLAWITTITEETFGDLTPRETALINFTAGLLSGILTRPEEVNPETCKENPEMFTTPTEPAKKLAPFTLDEYQEATRETAIYKAGTIEEALDYLVPALAAEAGEVAGKWAKWKRDTPWPATIPDELVEALTLEVGDTLWMVARIAADLGFSLSEVADSNIQKLQDRQQRGVLGGSGDDR